MAHVLGVEGLRKGGGSSFLSARLPRPGALEVGNALQPREECTPLHQSLRCFYLAGQRIIADTLGKWEGCLSTIIDDEESESAGVFREPC